MLIQKAQDLHEQAAVVKDNEIKRVSFLPTCVIHPSFANPFGGSQRDIMISALQERITELESSLAHAFQPTDVAQDLSTILNLKVSPAVNLGATDPLVRATIDRLPVLSHDRMDNQDATNFAPQAVMGAPAALVR